MAKKGRPKGTKKDDSKKGVVRFRCDVGDKCKWIKLAQKKGISLSQWIIDRLNL